MQDIFSQARPLVIDVTLRDGGYLNQWCFSEAHLQHAITMAERAQADFIEIGYVDNAPDLPLAAACPPAWLHTLKQTFPGVRFAGMIRPSVAQPEAVLASRRGLLDLLRIPVDLRWPDKAFALGEICHAHGFAVSFNLTGVSCFELAEIQAAAAAVPAFASVVYLADSRGALQPPDIAPLIACLQEVWPGEIGYHAHDSLGFAWANTRAAQAAGCEWLDGSLDGVGLGGRNLRLAEALDLARITRPQLQPDSAALQTPADAIGLHTLSEAEHPLYVRCAERNLRMEWVASLLTAFGLDRSHQILESLPRRNWFEIQELEAFIDPAHWQQIKW